MRHGWGKVKALLGHCRLGTSILQLFPICDPTEHNYCSNCASTESAPTLSSLCILSLLCLKLGVRFLPQLCHICTSTDYGIDVEGDTCKTKLLQHYKAINKLRHNIHICALTEVDTEQGSVSEDLSGFSWS